MLVFRVRVRVIVSVQLSLLHEGSPLSFLRLDVYKLHYIKVVFRVELKLYDHVQRTVFTSGFVQSSTLTPTLTMTSF
jgi:hypothetical protein